MNDDDKLEKSDVLVFPDGSKLECGDVLILVNGRKYGVLKIKKVLEKIFCLATTMECPVDIGVLEIYLSKDGGIEAAEYKGDDYQNIFYELIKDDIEDETD
ncbi:MAG: hypothetical protein FWD47_13530 [Treponema sp.]|nr:hypothetical protein [Treponema sp.]